MRIHLLIAALVIALGIAGCGSGSLTVAQPVSPTAPVKTASDACETLWAGQTIDAGDLLVSNDDFFLYVTYATSGGWELQLTHLAVADDLSGIPQTKKGNPIPGRFAYAAEHDPTVTTYTYVIPLSDLGILADDVLVIAAHAEVINGDWEETAWAGELEFPGRNWATYIEYTLEWGGWVPM